jgi:hypothetical protein
MRSSLSFVAALAPLVALSAACSGVADVGIAARKDAAADAPPDPGGPRVAIHLRATAEPFPHADGLSGQTPKTHAVGILSLRLGTSENDPEPLVVFDRGAEPVASSLDAGADTLVATVPAKTLRRGRYTWARVGVSHVAYRVASTMHAAGLHTPGEYDNVHVLTDGTFLEGAERPSGWYRFTFLAGGTPQGTRSGPGGPLPQLPSGPFRLEIAQGRAAYVFPTDVLVDPDVAADVALDMTVNVHEDFRWTDETGDGFAPGTFDTTPQTFEPVLRFGANAFGLALRPGA